MIPENDLFLRLSGGDRRSIGEADRVAAEVLRDPKLVATLVTGLGHDDPMVRMRCADAAEKVFRLQPGWFAPYTADLLARAQEPLGQEVRWHLAQILPHLPLTDVQRHDVETLLLAFLADRSKIVQSCALEGLFVLSNGDTAARKRAIATARTLALDGSPAVRARARHLLKANGTA